MDLIIDSTGLSIVGQGEWAAAKHGKQGKRGWRKLHIGVKGAGEIFAQDLIDRNVDDAETDVELIDSVKDDITCVIGDTAYDTAAIYEAASARGAKVLVPPVRRAVVSRSKLPLLARDKSVLRVNAVGRRKWKKVTGYHRLGRVENTFYSYKPIICGKLRARHDKAEVVGAALACRVLSRMGELGMPKSVAAAACSGWCSGYASLRSI
ncbi:MAG: hypothetical protein ACI9X4_002794 [Glaciecola sp.]